MKDAKSTVVVCVPALCVHAAKQAARGSKIKVGVQNMHWAASGAYTGELSADMCKACGVDYVIVGHSERRQYFGETDETVNKRALAVVRAGMTPIICVGERKEQREAGYTDALVEYQTLIALTGMTADEVKKVVIAYEPVWAIGTGPDRHRRAGQRDHRRHPRRAGPQVWQARGGQGAHSVRRQHEALQRGRPDEAARDRRRPDRRRVPEGGGLRPHRQLSGIIRGKAWN